MTMHPLAHQPSHNPTCQHDHAPTGTSAVVAGVVWVDGAVGGIAGAGGDLLGYLEDG